MKKNQLWSVNLTGGIIGLITGGFKRALQKCRTGLV